MSVKIGSARIDENGKARGGKAGDQTGREVSTQGWYRHNKGWRVFRAKSAEAAEKIAQDMQWACDNPHIGYDQGQRLTLYDVSKPLGFNCKKVDVNCETDCSALVRVCCAYAGISLPNFRTPTEPAALLDSGAFVELKGSRYTDTDKYLRRGDILVTRTQGHTVVVLSNGSKAGGEETGGLRRGDSGKAVKAMQEQLLKWNPDCLPECGADGDFGGETERAVKKLQKEKGLPVTGVYDGATEKALKTAVAVSAERSEAEGASAAPKGQDAPETHDQASATGVGRMVEITGGSVNVRSAPGVESRDIGTAHKGDVLPYQGVTKESGGRPWYLVIYKNENGWISSKYSELVE